MNKPRCFLLNERFWGCLKSHAAIVLLYSVLHRVRSRQDPDLPHQPRHAEGRRLYHVYYYDYYNIIIIIIIMSIITFIALIHV